MPFYFLPLFFTSFISPLKLKFIASFWFMVETVCLLLLVRFHCEREKREVELVQTFCKCATAPVQTFTYVSPLSFPPFTRAVNIAEEFICYWRIKWKRQVRNCLDFMRFIREGKRFSAQRLANKIYKRSESLCLCYFFMSRRTIVCGTAIFDFKSALNFSMRTLLDGNMI